MDMLPDVLDNTNFRYLKVDNKYIVSVSIKSLPENIYFLDLLNILPKNISYNFSMYVKKIDAIRALNEITYNIGTTMSEISSVNNNQRNIDVVSKSKEEAIELRKKIQTENQEIYYINLIITFYSLEVNSLLKFLSEFKSKLYSKGIVSETTNFRHKDFYLSNLPLMLKKEELVNNICVTTDTLTNLFMFCRDNIMDLNGIDIGTTNNAMCKLDIFSNKYENSNMCIFGSSGSGKSYFTKLFCIRNFVKNKTQIILDIEGEYEKICRALGGIILFKDSYLNILEIAKRDLDYGEDFLNQKIQRVIEFLNAFMDIDKANYFNIIHELYSDFKITEDINSILVSNTDENVDLTERIISPKYFPTLEDLCSKIQNMKELTIFKKLLFSELKYFSKTSTIDINSTNFFVLNTQEIIKYPKLMSMLLDKVMEDASMCDTGTILYIDEIWKYAQSKELISKIYDMYKTIRKRNASIISITQDIGDFFEYKNGFYANSILNNCNFKVFFKTEYKETNNYINMIDKEEIRRLTKGEAILCVGNNTLKFKVKASGYEREILDEDDNSCR